MERYVNWRMQRRYSIGTLGYRPAEMIDTLLWLRGEGPPTITAVGKKSSAADSDTYVQFHVTMEFRDQSVTSFQMIDNQSFWKSSELFVGKNASMVLSDVYNGQNFLLPNPLSDEEEWHALIDDEGLVQSKSENDP